MKKEKIDKRLLIILIIVLTMICSLSIGAAFASDVSITSDDNSGDLNTIVSSQESTTNDSLSLNTVSNLGSDENSNNQDSASILGNSLNQNQVLEANNKFDRETLSNQTITITEDTTYTNSVFTNMQFIINDDKAKLTFDNCTFYNYEMTTDITAKMGSLKVKDSTFIKQDLYSITDNKAIVYGYNTKINLINNEFYNYATLNNGVTAKTTLSGYNENQFNKNNIFKKDFSLSDLFRVYFWVRADGSYPPPEFNSNSTSQGYDASKYYPYNGNSNYRDWTGLVSISQATKYLGIDIIGGMSHPVSSNHSVDINKLITEYPELMDKWINENQDLAKTFVNEKFIQDFLHMYYPEYYNQYMNGKLDLTSEGYTVWCYVLKAQTDSYHVDGAVVPKKLLNLIQQKIAEVGAVNDIGYAGTVTGDHVVKTNDALNGTANILVYKDGKIYQNITVKVKNGVSEKFTLNLPDEGVYNTSVNFTSDKYYIQTPVSYGYLTSLPYETIISDKESTGAPFDKVDIITNIKVNTTGFTNKGVPNGSVTITGPNGYEETAEIINGVIIAKNLVYPASGKTNVYTITYNGVTNFNASVGTITLYSKVDATGMESVNKTGYYDKTIDVTIQTSGISQGETISFTDNNGTLHSAIVGSDGTATFKGLAFPDYGTTYTYNVSYVSTSTGKSGCNSTIILNSLQYPTIVTNFTITGYRGELKNITVTISTTGSELIGELTITDVFGKTLNRTINVDGNISTVTFEDVNLTTEGTFDNIKVNFVSNNLNYNNSANTSLINVLVNRTSMNNTESTGYYDKTTSITITTSGINDGEVISFTDNNGMVHNATVSGNKATFNDLAYPDYGTTYTYNVSYVPNNTGIIGSNCIITLKSNKYPTTVSGFDIFGYRGELNNITVTISTTGSQIIGKLTITDVFGKTLSKTINVNGNIATVTFEGVNLTTEGNFSGIKVDFTSTNVNYDSSNNIGKIKVIVNGTGIYDESSVNYYDKTVNVTVHTLGIKNGENISFTDNNGIVHNATVYDNKATFNDLAYPDFGTTYTYNVTYNPTNPSFTGSKGTITLGSNQYITGVTGFTISGYKGDFKSITITVSTNGSQIIGNLSITNVFGQIYSKYLNVNGNTTNVTFDNVNLASVGNFSNINVSFISDNINYADSANTGNISVDEIIVPPVDPVEPVEPVDNSTSEVPEEPNPDTGGVNTPTEPDEIVVPIIPDTNLPPSDERKDEDEDEDDGDEVPDPTSDTVNDSGDNTNANPGDGGNTDGTANPVSPILSATGNTGTTTTSPVNAATNNIANNNAAISTDNGRDISVTAIENFDENQKVNSSSFLGDVAYNESLGELRRREEKEVEQAEKELDKEGVKY